MDDGATAKRSIRNSTALIASRRPPPRLGMRAQAGLHHTAGADQPQYFPGTSAPAPASSRYDYDRENYVLLWFFGGFASYYDDLLPRRARAAGRRRLSEAAEQDVNQVMQTQGVSCSRSRAASWLTPGLKITTQQDENTPNTYGELPPKGALVALARPDAAPGKPRHAGRGDARTVGALRRSP